MKVYVLSSMPVHAPASEAIIGVYSKPKNAKKVVDAELGVSTRKKWKKCNDKNIRRYESTDTTYYVEEFIVDEN